jgi:hypothetical protein
LKRNIVIKENNFFVVLFSPHSSAVSIPHSKVGYTINSSALFVIYISETRNDSVNSNKLSKRKEKKKNGIFWKCFYPASFIFYSTARMLSKCSFSFIFRHWKLKALV